MANFGYDILLLLKNYIHIVALMINKQRSFCCRIIEFLYNGLFIKLGLNHPFQRTTVFSRIPCFMLTIKLIISESILRLVSMRYECGTNSSTFDNGNLILNNGDNPTTLTVSSGRLIRYRKRLRLLNDRKFGC